MSESILAWHFVGKTLRNGEPIPDDGVWLEWDGPLVMCQSGLHASRHPFDALRYAPGFTMCRVECAGSVIEEKDKLICTRRKIIERRDAKEGVLYFARMQALSVVHLWNPPEIVLDYLMTGANAAAYALSAANAAAYALSAANAAAYAAADAAYAAAYALSAADAAYAAAYAAYAAAYAANAADAAARSDWASLVNEAFNL